jgi:hypothetical protein
MDLQIPAPVVTTTSSDEVVVTSSESVLTDIETGIVSAPTLVVTSFPAIAVPSPAAVFEALQTQHPQEVGAELAAPSPLASSTLEANSDVIATPVAVSRNDISRQGESLGIWLIGAGSLSLIAMGLYRRFSGR